MSRVVRSCLTSHSLGGSRHLVCIGALKKLCNDPSLIYPQCQEAKNVADSWDIEEVTCTRARAVFNSVESNFAFALVLHYYAL